MSRKFAALRKNRSLLLPRSVLEMVGQVARDPIALRDLGEIAFRNRCLPSSVLSTRKP